MRTEHHAVPVILAMLVGLTGACSTSTGTDDDHAPPDSIGAVALMVHDLTTVPGTWLQDPVRITDTAGRTLNVQPAWTSTAPAIVAVDAAGGITVLGPGTARVIARLGSRADTLRVEAVLVRFTDVALAPEATTCGVTAADDVFCWGSVPLGDLRTSDQALYLGTHGPVKVANLPGIGRLSAGSEHFCTAVGGSARCWGGNRIGMLGLGTVDSVFHPTPTAVPGHTFSQLTGGWFSTCGLDAAGDAHCWGYNGYGELGDSTYGTIRPTPVKVRGEIAFQSLAGGLAHTCGLDAEGIPYCWGEGSAGVVGPAADRDTCIEALGGGLYCTVPVPVDTSLRLTALDVGWAHACGVTAGGTVMCWGYGFGPRPLTIAGSDTFASVSTGNDHTCALTTTGAAWCWGGNGAGQLGNGQVDAGSSTPVAVVGGHVFRTIRAGGGVTCGLRTDGRLYCWGSNYWGQIGDGSDYSVPLRAVPTEVVGQQRP